MGVFAKSAGRVARVRGLWARRLYVEFDPAKTTEALFAVAAKGESSRTPEQASLRLLPPSMTSTNTSTADRLANALSLSSASRVARSPASPGASSRRAWPRSPRPALRARVRLGAWFTVKEVPSRSGRASSRSTSSCCSRRSARRSGEWFEGALLLFSSPSVTGSEGYAMRRARNAIGALAKSSGDGAAASMMTAAGRGGSCRARGGRSHPRNPTRIPADGFVSAGSSSVNQAPITGESVPVDKRPVLDVEAALVAPGRWTRSTVCSPAPSTGQRRSPPWSRRPRARAPSLRREVGRRGRDAEVANAAVHGPLERAFVPIILVFVVGLLFAWSIDEPFAATSDIGPWRYSWPA